MKKYVLMAAAFLGLLNIILGAFAAHQLNPLLNQMQISSFKTGLLYHMFHVLFLLWLGSSFNASERKLKIIFTLITVGIIFFSGSIYLLATNELTTPDYTKIALLTPLGGLMLISGWGYLLAAVSGMKKNKA